MYASIRRHIGDIIEPPSAHLRVLGPPGCGKTELLLEYYQHLLADAQDEPTQSIIVTYTRESRDYLTSAVLPKESARLGRMPVHTYTTLASEVLSAPGGNSLRIMEEMEELVLLEHILTHACMSLKSDYTSVVRSVKFQRFLLDVIHLLLQNGISPEDVRKLTDHPEVNGRIKDVLTIYQAYCKQLQDRGLVTYYDISWRAAEALEKRPDRNPFEKTKVFLIDDFQDVDPGQFALLQAIAPPSGNAAVIVFGDPTGAHFRYRGTQHRFLMGTFPALYGCRTIHLPAVSADSDRMGKVIEALLEETTGEDAKYYLPLESKDLISTDDAQAGVPGGGSSPFHLAFRISHDELKEVFHVAGHVKALLEQGRCEPHDIAVAAREKPRYEPLLSAAFLHHGIPLDTGRRRPTFIEDFIYNLLSLLHSRNDGVLIESLQFSPLYQSFKFKVIERFEVLPPENNGGDEVAFLSAALDHIMDRLFAGRADQWMGVFLGEYILPALHELDEKEKRPSMYVFISNLLASWKHYIEAVKRIEGKVRPELINDFMNKCGLFGDSITNTAPTPGCVGFYSCHELKSRTFPVVFLVGCSEMLFPAVKAGEEFIPYEALQHVFDTVLPDRGIEVHAAQSTGFYMRDEFSLLLLALTRASEMLFITAPGKFGGREETGPTTIIRDHLPDEVVEYDPPQVDLEKQTIPPIIRFASCMTSLSGEHQADRAHRIEKALSGMSPVPLLWCSKPVNRHPVQIQKRPLSPSSLQAYDTCPRQYFYSRILKLPKEETIAMKFGTLFHEVMKRLGLQFPSMRQLHAGATPERTREIVDAVLEEEDLREKTLIERSIRHYLEGMARKCLEMDARRTDDYTIHAVEDLFQFTYRKFAFAGYIDRLDISDNGPNVVIDYKTGEIAKTGGTIRKRVLESASDPAKRDWQIPVYSHGVLACGKNPPLVFSYYNIQADEDPVVVSLLIDKTQTGVDSTVLFDEAVGKRFGYLLLDEIEGCMDDAVHLAERIFSPTVFFGRTEDEERCGYCTYRDICKRSKGWE